MLTACACAVDFDVDRYAGDSTEFPDRYVRAAEASAGTMPYVVGVLWAVLLLSSMSWFLARHDRPAWLGVASVALVLAVTGLWLGAALS